MSSRKNEQSAMSSPSTAPTSSSPFRDALRATTRRTPTPSKSPHPPTIDENKSLLDSPGMQTPVSLFSPGANDDALLVNLSASRGALSTSATGMTVRSMRQWDVRMGPIKKHVVAGRLMPTVTGTMSKLLLQKKRRITLEVHRPETATKTSDTPRKSILDVWKKPGASNDVDLSLTDATYLGDTDEVIIRIFKRVKGSGKQSDASVGGDADDHSESSYGSTSVISPGMAGFRASLGFLTDPLTMTDEQGEWKEHRRYQFNEVHTAVEEVNGRVIELMLGSGSERSVRDVKFESEDEVRSFLKVLNVMSLREKERADRQLDRYRQQKLLKGQKMAQQEAPATPTTTDEEAKSRDIQDLLSVPNDDENINLLVEIVGATDLPVADISSTDPYVVVRMGGKDIHRTGVISKDLDPIWTLRSGSLFLITMTPDEFFSATSGMGFIVKDYDAFGKNELLGSVYVPLNELLKGKGERVDYEIKTERQFRRKDSSAKHGKLYLRYKEASESDIKFMKEFEADPNAVGTYSKETFMSLRAPKPKFLRRQGKRGEDFEYLHRVRPFPDPEREDETKWMSKEKIVEESMKPSRHWVEAGSGDLGMVYLEVLGCSKLPNMDVATTNIRDKTDAFACIVFEDAIMMTDVIGDTLSPRWMPWCRRAFAFRVSHPSSILTLGIFDYDPELSPLQVVSRATSSVHDPIGRVLIHMSNFHEDTVYTLAYPLYYGVTAEQRSKERGTIWMRLRVEWRDVKKAFLTAASPPPENHVSVARAIDFDIAHYTTEGPYDDTPFNLTTLTTHIEEIQSYQAILNYVKEALLTVWLWRGHCEVTVKGRQLELPIHSMVAFTWGLLVSWNFDRFPSFLLFSIGWIFLACNEFVRRNPSPWQKCKRYWPMWSLLLFSKRHVRDQDRIEPQQQHKEYLDFKKKSEERERRWRREAEIEVEYMEELNKQYGLDMDQMPEEDVEIASTKAKILEKLNVNPLKPVLYPIQQQLRDVVIYLRITKSIILWEESYFAFWITTGCFAGSLLIFWLPFAFIFRWLLRVAVIVFLGPWMAIVDRKYFQEKPGMTEAERDEIVRERVREKYKAVLDAATDYRVRKERALKLRSMTKYLYGKYQLRVPRFSEDLFKDTPSPESYSEYFDEAKTPPTEIAERRYGQALLGDMIPVREIQARELEARRNARILNDAWEQTEKLTGDLVNMTGDIALKTGDKALRSGGKAVRKHTTAVVGTATKTTESVPLLGRIRGLGGRSDYQSIGSNE